MTKIKFCGLTRQEDILSANQLMPDLIGFVFWEKSRRYIEADAARRLRGKLAPGILAAGIFVNAPLEEVAGLLNSGVIDIAQLHGDEGEEYISNLRERTQKPIFSAFKIGTPEDLQRAALSGADCILLDAGMGAGKSFDWKLLRDFNRPYFLAGGLNCENVREAVRTLHPYGLDVSSGIETNNVKDPKKMAAFMAAVREEDER